MLCQGFFRNTTRSRLSFGECVEHRTKKNIPKVLTGFFVVLIYHRDRFECVFHVTETVCVADLGRELLANQYLNHI